MNKDTMPAFDRAGFNLVAVMSLDALPASALTALREAGYFLAHYRQVLLLGHGGKQLWSIMKAQGMRFPDPVDTYTRETVKRLLDEALQRRRYDVVYPGGSNIDLQQFGTLAGWHHASPYWVGINRRFGSWFAYRALILAESDIPLTAPWREASPCQACVDKPCLQACPAGALNTGSLELTRCLTYRRQPGAACRYQCLARNACPVGAEHRYDDDQMKHHYAASLKFIDAMPEPKR